VPARLARLVDAGQRRAKHRAHRGDRLVRAAAALVVPADVAGETEAPDGDVRPAVVPPDQRQVLAALLEVEQKLIEPARDGLEVFVLERLRTVGHQVDAIDAQLGRRRRLCTDWSAADSA
jgi:hypothetical protein